MYYEKRYTKKQIEYLEGKIANGQYNANNILLEYNN